ncbi:hypothetical protein [Janibacter sp. GXQ6167]
MPDWYLPVPVAVIGVATVGLVITMVMALAERRLRWTRRHALADAEGSMR